MLAYTSVLTNIDTHIPTRGAFYMLLLSFTIVRLFSLQQLLAIRMETMHPAVLLTKTRTFIKNSQLIIDYCLTILNPIITMLGRELHKRWLG